MRGPGQQWSGIAPLGVHRDPRLANSRGRILLAHEVHIGTMSLGSPSPVQMGQSQPRTGVVLCRHRLAAGGTTSTQISSPSGDSGLGKWMPQRLAYSHNDLTPEGTS